MVDVTPRAGATTVSVGPRPRGARLALSMASNDVRRFVRVPLAAFFTLLFPLLFLLLLATLLGNPIVQPALDVRVAQYLVPLLSVFGVAMAAYTSLAVHVATDRERGVLKRLHGTPLPTWAHLGGLALSRLLLSAVAVAIVTAAGVAFFDVHVVWHRLPAVAVTLVAGVACFTALGLAVAGFVRSSAAAQALTLATLLPLCFVSGVFVDIAELPSGLAAIGNVFPLRHVADAMVEGFVPGADGWGLRFGDLAVVLLWTLAGALVAMRRLSWEPAPARAHQPPETAEVEPVEPAAPGAAIRDDATRPAGADADVPAGPSPRPSWWSLVRAQTRYTLRTTVRDRTTLVLAVAFPTVLMAVMGTVDRALLWDGVPRVQHDLAGFTAYGVAIAAYVTLPQAMTLQIESGVLKRLTGTPLPMSAYLAARLAVTALLGFAVAWFVGLVAVISYDARVEAAPLPAAVATILVGTATCAALGLVLAFAVRSSRAVTAVGLGTLLPLAFLSDVFVVGGAPPQTLSVIGWLLPLRHFTAALYLATGPGVMDWAAWLGHIGVLALWFLAAAAVAWLLAPRALPRVG
ncbi:MAG: ABC transporter permease [Dermatophilaceae bacterium]